MGIATTHLQTPAATRNDLFALQACTMPLVKGIDVTRQWLDDLGFAISEPHPEHWVLTHLTPLPELHFYSALELEQFARQRAHHYAKRSFKENRP